MKARKIVCLTLALTFLISAPMSAVSFSDLNLSSLKKIDLKSKTSLYVGGGILAAVLLGILYKYLSGESPEVYEPYEFEDNSNQTLVNAKNNLTHVETRETDFMALQKELVNSTDENPKIDEEELQRKQEELEVLKKYFIELEFQKHKIEEKKKIAESYKKISQQNAIVCKEFLETKIASFKKVLIELEQKAQNPESNTDTNQLSKEIEILKKRIEIFELQLACINLENQINELKGKNQDTSELDNQLEQKTTELTHKEKDLKDFINPPEASLIEKIAGLKDRTLALETKLERVNPTTIYKNVKVLKFDLEQFDAKLELFETKVSENDESKEFEKSELDDEFNELNTELTEIESTINASVTVLSLGYLYKRIEELTEQVRILTQRVNSATINEYENEDRKVEITEEEIKLEGFEELDDVVSEDLGEVVEKKEETFEDAMEELDEVVEKKEVGEAAKEEINEEVTGEEENKVSDDEVKKEKVFDEKLNEKKKETTELKTKLEEKKKENSSVVDEIIEKKEEKKENKNKEIAKKILNNDDKVEKTTENKKEKAKKAIIKKN